MKRLISVFLVLLTFAVPAFADEIMFRGIPWGSNVESALKELDLRNVDGSEADLQSESVTRCRYTRPTIDDFGYMRMPGTGYYRDCGFSYEFYSSIRNDPFLKDKDVAGYKLAKIELQFMYGIVGREVSTEESDAQLVTGKYELKIEEQQVETYKSAYEDLLDKLVWLYGEPAEQNEGRSERYSKSDWVEKYSLWRGDNDTAILLYVKYYNDDSPFSWELSIEYGKTGISGELEYIEKYWENKERGEKYNAENTNGL